MDRERVIEKLIVEVTHRFVAEQRTTSLTQMLESGFRGFRNMNDEELAMELSRYGLDIDDDLRPVVEYDDDQDIDDYEYDMALMAGYSGMELDTHPLHDK